MKPMAFALPYNKQMVVRVVLKTVFAQFLGANASRLSRACGYHRPPSCSIVSHVGRQASFCCIASSGRSAAFKTRKAAPLGASRTRLIDLNLHRYSSHSSNGKNTVGPCEDGRPRQECFSLRPGVVLNDLDAAAAHVELQDVKFTILDSRGHRLQTGTVAISEVRRIASEHSMDVAILSVSSSHPPFRSAICILRQRRQQSPASADSAALGSQKAGQERGSSSRYSRRNAPRTGEKIKFLQIFSSMQERDLNIRIGRAREFLGKGFKVNISVALRRQNEDAAQDVLRGIAVKITEALKDVTSTRAPRKNSGARKIELILVPLSDKLEKEKDEDDDVNEKDRVCGISSQDESEEKE